MSALLNSLLTRPLQSKLGPGKRHSVHLKTLPEEADGPNGVSTRELTGAVCNCFFKVGLGRGRGIKDPIQEDLAGFPKAAVLKRFPCKVVQGPATSWAPIPSALE